MQSQEIRRRYLAFFEKRGHKVIPSASLVPENDPSVLFTTAGMQPLVPYLLGQPHPQGKRLVSIQKCVRTGDLDDIGDNRHFSFFQMMGNWSLSDYFKEDAIKWSYEFLTSKEEGLGLDPNKLYVTVFEGDENAPEDTEAVSIWNSVGIPNSRIYKLGVDDNWWSPGENGPCGPDTEMFYDLTDGLGELSKEEFLDAVKREDLVEIWNDVFMEYEKRDGKVIGKLASKNVDTGAGLERMTAVMQRKKTAYDTELFAPIIETIKDHSSAYDEKSARIIADHIRAAVFMIADGVKPSNTAQGYVLRKILRRAIANCKKLKIDSNNLSNIINSAIHNYSDVYAELNMNKSHIMTTIQNESEGFGSVLVNAQKYIDRKAPENATRNLETGEEIILELNGKDLFELATTHGLPVDIAIEYAKEKNVAIRSDALKQFNTMFEDHQKKSQTSSAGMFKGGLGNHNEQTIKLHTAHHLLLSALQQVLGKSVKQRGSNITEERLRMDFSFDRKMTDEEKAMVETIVNDYIQADLPVIRREMPRIEAESLGAEMEFGAKYPDIVSIYFVEDKNGNAISKEFCGGPHVERTGVLGTFKIQKEEASSQGVRRIKATLS